VDQALAVPVSLAENNGGLSLCDARAGATPRAAWVTMYARRQRLFMACAVTRRRFPVGASPTRQSLQPEAIGAVMEVTKWLKPSISVSRSAGLRLHLFRNDHFRCCEGLRMPAP